MIIVTIIKAPEDFSCFIKKGKLIILHAVNRKLKALFRNMGFTNEAIASIGDGISLNQLLVAS